MAKRHSSFDYETLVRFMLPNGILDYFEITKIDEEVTNEKDETGTVIRILYIYLDERDLREVTWHDLQPNGFYEESSMNDFPIREYRTVLHVRRRRWKDAEGKSVSKDWQMVAKGTRYSKEFATFLKEFLGYIPDYGQIAPETISRKG